MLKVRQETIFVKSNVQILMKQVRNIWIHRSLLRPRISGSCFTIQFFTFYIGLRISQSTLENKITRIKNACTAKCLVLWVTAKLYIWKALLLLYINKSFQENHCMTTWIKDSPTEWGHFKTAMKNGPVLSKCGDS